MKRLPLIFLIMTTAISLAGATEDPGGRFTAILTGADVRPPVDTETDGRFSISFNEEETEGRVYLRVNDGVGITEAHLHCRQLTFASGQNPIAVTLLEPIPGGKDIDRVVDPFILEDEQIAAQNSACDITTLRELREAIVRGRIYADVHSVAHPGGEIQGQVSFYRQDTDGDGLIDRRDPDIDGDGIPNADDDTPYTQSPPKGGVGGGVPDERVVAFHFDPNDGGGALYCNNLEKDKPVPEEPAPFTGIFKCSFNGNGDITIERANWGGPAVLPQDDNITGSMAVLREDDTITGSCVGSVRPTENVKDDYVLDPGCLRLPPPPRIAANGGTFVDEWFTDIPWHQKLSTKDSNLIDVPFVLPFEALEFPANASCPSDAPAIVKSRCMLRYGIVNVMGMHRTDTLYQPDEAAHATDQDCQNSQCVEVKLKVQRFHTLTDHPDGYEADIITNNEYSYLDPDRPPDKPNQMIRVPSQGYAITEATIFAPWHLPWYTGHYCAVDKSMMMSMIRSLLRGLFHDAINSPCGP